MIFVCSADRDLAQLSYIEATVYDPIMVTVKISILLQYITLFVAHRGTAFYYAVHCVMWTNIVYYTILLLLDIFEVSNSIVPQPCPFLK